MFTYEICAAVPERGGRVQYGGGGGVVEVEGRVVWGGLDGRRGGVYRFDEVSSEWVRLADGGEVWATLVVCGGELVSVGGLKDLGGVCSNEVMVLLGGRSP